MMRGLRAALGRLLPPGARTRIGTVVDRLGTGATGLPWLGRLLWRRRSAELLARPGQLNLEVTSICNAKCVMCPRHGMNRAMELMPWHLYDKIVREAADLGVRRFALNGYGELFTARRDYKRYVDHLMKAIPGARIIINTNGSLLNEDAARYLIDRGVDTVHCDIDGATAETFERIRENLHYDEVVRNVRRLLELRNAAGKAFPRVRVGIIRQPMNEAEVALHRAQWAGVADFVGDDFLVNRGGDVRIPHLSNVGRPCSLPWFELNIYSDGSAVLCCDDWNAREPMGNAKVQTIAEIWRGERFARCRRLHAEGRAAEIPLCSKCNWARPGPDWFQAGLRRFS